MTSPNRASGNHILLDCARKEGEWQARWTDEVRPLHHLKFHRSAFVARPRRLLKAVARRLRGLRHRSAEREAEAPP